MHSRRAPGDGAARDRPATGRSSGAGSSGADPSGAGSAGAAAASTTVAVRVRPGAGRTRVGGRYDGPRGPALVVAVGAPAVDGRATEAVRRALADALGVRAGAVLLRLGATSRDKVFSVDGDPRTLGDRLAALRDGPGGGGP